MLQLYTRYIFKRKFCVFYPEQPNLCSAVCYLPVSFLKRPTTNSRHQVVSHALYFFLFSSCFKSLLLSSNSLKAKLSLYTFYNCYINIVRTVPEHNDRSKPLTHPKVFLLGAAKGAQNLTWAPTPLNVQQGFCKLDGDVSHSISPFALTCRVLQVVVIFSLLLLIGSANL